MSQVNELQETWPGGATFGMDVTLAQANAAGGAIRLDVSCTAAGSEFIVMYGQAVNSGTNGLGIAINSATPAAVVKVDGVASVAGAAIFFPKLGTVMNLANEATGAIGAGYGLPLIVSGTDLFSIEQSAAGAQNDTLRVLMRIRLRGSGPSVAFGRSTNPANVSVTAGAASFTAL